MQGDQVWRWIPPEFTVKHLAIGLVLLGFAVGCLIDAAAPWFWLLLCGGMMYMLRREIEKKKRYLPFALVCFIALSAGCMISIPVMYGVWYMLEARGFDPALREVDSRLASPLEQLILFGGGSTAFVFSLITWKYYTVLLPCLEALPKGWDTPVRYYLD